VALRVYPVRFAEPYISQNTNQLFVLVVKLEKLVSQEQAYETLIDFMINLNQKVDPDLYFFSERSLQVLEQWA
jgi:hypothetical protein